MTKRIIPIIALVLIGLVAIATVVLALVPKNHAPNIGSPARISISSMNDQVFDANDDADIYNKIINAYNKSFTESSLNALFQGRLCNGAEAKYQQDSLTYLSSLSKYLRFDFNTDKTVKVQTKDISYRSVVVELEDNEGMYDVKLYLLAHGSTSTNYYISTIADLGNLVSVIDEVENA